ncbi:hypothetical protein ACFQV2_20630 [Actinokineospora soli]|uniref:Uncharacterized protein n=1 Tax=Actinokineospora soli TaxID=1048753 RepID=A0ABW2TP23_9PSEU
MAQHGRGQGQVAPPAVGEACAAGGGVERGALVPQDARHRVLGVVVAQRAEQRGRVQVEGGGEPVGRVGQVRRSTEPLGEPAHRPRPQRARREGFERHRVGVGPAAGSAVDHLAPPVRRAAREDEHPDAGARRVQQVVHEPLLVLGVVDHQQRAGQPEPAQRRDRAR